MHTCDFTLCIYQQYGCCKLNDIDINALGLCDNVIVIDLSEEQMALEKKRQQLAMENRKNGKLE